MKQTNLQIEEDQHDWLRKQAFEKNISLAQVVRDIIAEAMRKETNEPNLSNPQ